MSRPVNHATIGDPKDWTVMFYFAADNALSPLIVSQVRAIKDAGFQEDTNVLVHFDPSEHNAPTRVYNVNKQRKLDRLAEGKRATLIGDAANSFVPNMQEDHINPEDIDASLGPSSAAMQKQLINPDEVLAWEALENFIGYSLENFPAKHYILFLVGHGMIVGNDTFMPDDMPDSGITLPQLKEILEKKFTPKGAATSLELLALHSCSMSSVEIAYELKGIANYMMACQGTSYVGSWPYRQMLKKIFNTVDKAKHPANGAKQNGGPPVRHEVDVEELVEKLYYHSLFNSTDFMVAGYSSEMSLCSLKPEKVHSLTAPLKALVSLLKQGLTDERGPVEDLIQLAHLKSQSYWSESYTDLYDFCRCLREQCRQRIDSLLCSVPSGSSILGPFVALSNACQDVIETLETVKTKDNTRAARAERFKALVVQSDHFGSRYQYSHGLSIYFPWAEPLNPVPANGPVGAGGAKPATTLTMANYRGYRFNSTAEMDSDSWASFLDLYFAETMRERRANEEAHDQKPAIIEAPAEPEVVGVGISVPTFGASSAIGKVVANVAASSAGSGFAEVPATGALAGGDGKPAPSLAGGDGKPSPSIGQGCSCPTIKNFPPTTDDGTGRKRIVAMSPGAAQAFKIDRDRDCVLAE